MSEEIQPDKKKIFTNRLVNPQEKQPKTPRYSSGVVILKNPLYILLIPEDTAGCDGGKLRVIGPPRRGNTVDR